MARLERSWKVGAVQMTSTEDIEGNLKVASRLVRGAADDGARLVALPENFAFLRTEGAPLGFKTPIDGEVVQRMSALARECEIFLLLGSIPEALPRRRRIANTSLLLGPDGRTRALYRKIHLFDIDIEGGVSLQESKNVLAGDEPVLVQTRLGRLGLSICYDLRFPELYRQLALSGAQVLFVPAAFTAYTGPHHWLPLLRARAIENLCWVVAPAQVGEHNPERRSHGETVVIDPWGKVTARLPRRVGWITAEIDLRRLSRLREGLPCLRHTRAFLFDKPRGRPAR